MFDESSLARRAAGVRGARDRGVGNPHGERRLLIIETQSRRKGICALPPFRGWSAGRLGTYPFDLSNGSYSDWIGERLRVRVA